MKKYLGTVLTVLVVIAVCVLAIVLPPASQFGLTQLQLDTLMILGIICGGSALYCFVS